MELTRLDPEDLLVEEDNCIERLVLRSGGDLPLDREIAQERFDLGRARLAWVPPSAGPAVEAQEGHDPVPIRSFGPEGVVLPPDDRRELIEELHRDRQNTTIPNRMQTTSGRFCFAQGAPSGRDAIAAGFSEFYGAEGVSAAGGLSPVKLFGMPLAFSIEHGSIPAILNSA
jgi:hypothetical protein